MQNYKLGKVIGEGASGKVYRASTAAGSDVVVKIIKLGRCSKKEQEFAMNEVQILKKLNHPNVIRYFDSFVTDVGLHIVMELAEQGNLTERLRQVARSGRKLSEETVWSYFAQVVAGLQHIHSKKILHRDLKTLNIFLNDRGDVKIGDLGVAKSLDTESMAHTFVGTPLYLSPELCEGRAYNDRSDIWALGCVLYELCTLRHPFESSNQAQLITKILRGHVSLPSSFSPELQSLLSLLLSRDPRRRPSSSSLLRSQKISAALKPTEAAADPSKEKPASKSIAEKIIEAAKIKSGDVSPVQIKAAAAVPTKQIQKIPAGAAAREQPKQKIIAPPSTVGVPSGNLAPRRVRVRPGGEAIAPIRLRTPLLEKKVEEKVAVKPAVPPPQPRVVAPAAGPPVVGKPGVSDLRRAAQGGVTREKIEVQRLPDRVTPSVRSQPKSGSPLDFRDIDLDALLADGGDETVNSIGFAPFCTPAATIRDADYQYQLETHVPSGAVAERLSPSAPLSAIQEVSFGPTQNFFALDSPTEEVQWRVVDLPDGEATPSGEHGDDGYFEEGEQGDEEDEEEIDEEDEAILERARRVEETLIHLRNAVVRDIGEDLFQRLYTDLDSRSKLDLAGDDDADLAEKSAVGTEILLPCEEKEKVMAAVCQILYLEDTLGMLADQLKV